MQIESAKHDAANLAPVSRARTLWARIIEKTAIFWYDLAAVESSLLRRKLAHKPITRPIYITGLARAGTTILLEQIASHQGVATHRYKDFPMIPVSYGWRWFLKRFTRTDHVPQERSHLDGLLVTPESPQAFEEMIWMRFFPESHRDNCNMLLDANKAHAEFEAFYKNHIGKLMLSEDASRYAAKGNYNVARLGYIQRLFPDAVFVIAVRNPEAHIASLMKQHQWFSKAQAADKGLLDYMNQAGHYEFGLGRRIPYLGDPDIVQRIRTSWSEGREVEGWALYWDYIYRHVADFIESPLGKNIVLVRYEDLCAKPADELSRLWQSCGLPHDTAQLSQAASRIEAPSYYKTNITEDMRSLIHSITGKTAARLGY